MSRHQQQRPPQPAAPEADVWIVGLKKYPPREKLGVPLYAVVTGTLAAPVEDRTPEPLQFASEMLKRAIHHLIDNTK